ncbi:MAG: DEAD/DEAH box helicase [Anaerolineae bacterium]|nr:DEAD/DEAH box helicase [Anaerolineae bacterium]
MLTVIAPRGDRRVPHGPTPEGRCKTMLDPDPPHAYGLSAFLEPVRTWFEAQFGAPTPPQAQGWPAIQRGEHTLILSPTGSGKTLAAFLWGIDQLFHELTGAQGEATEGGAEGGGGVRLIYISPLKALNNDIRRNLRVPLAGIRRTARDLGLDYPSIRVAVRSGDTPQRDRRAMLRQPPQILITTPESFYLLLTSPVARDMFRTVRTVIVDEIHTLAGNKRGVHLSLSLERLQHLANGPVQRLGLSATIQPLDEVARFLGGSAWQGEGDARVLQPRPVTVVDAGYEKPLDIRVVSVVENYRQLPGDSIWPSIIPRVLREIQAHRTTLIFVNNRRLAERTADRLNEQSAAEEAGRATGLIEGGVAVGVGMMAAGKGEHPGPIRVHHGSVSKEARLELERQLKAGELPALVGTSSLELGIDIGAVDLVVQLQSCKSVAQGLQRVGRSGHLVGQTSVGRIYPTHREDVVEAAAIAGGMLRREVEPTHTPRQPLDVLAQQIVAMVSVEPWDVEALYDLVRCAYAYNELTQRVYLTTLGMLAGRYPSEAYRELRARLSWDRVNHKLSELPGSRMLALTNGGTIPDTGAFGAYLGDGKTKLGELDEEFVFETRIGDTLMLGSQVWRVIDVTDDRVVVSEAPGAIPRMPFWRGDYPWRPYELGKRVGAFRRAVVERLVEVGRELSLAHLGDVRDHREAPPVQAMLDWLSSEYALDAFSAWHIVDYVSSQLDDAGAISSDRTILVEVFEDALGDPRLVIHSPFGGRINGSWGLALSSALRERIGLEVEMQTNDDGILFRLLDAEGEFPLDLVTQIGPAEARERILRELPNSAVFGARFRQNAARALLLPGGRPGRRTPFWLQRLRARDLLQVVRDLGDFPIVAETYRDCLQDVLDLAHLEEVLAAIQGGEIDVIVTESVTPSPVAQSLLWDLINVHMYEWDTPRAERQLQELAVNRDLLQDLLVDVALDELLRPEAIDEVRARLQHTAPTAQARTPEELAVLVQQMGDLSTDEIASRTTVDPAGWIAHLAAEGRMVPLSIPTAQGSEMRWVAAEYASLYATAFDLGAEGERVGASPLVQDREEAQRQILERYLRHAGPVTEEGIRARYAFSAAWLHAELGARVAARELVHGRLTPRAGEPVRAPSEFIDRHTLEQIHRRTMHILRREVQPVPLTAYADFLACWQHLAPSERLSGDGALVRVLQQLRAAPVVGPVWERDVLPLRLVQYQPAELDALCESGEVVWVGSGGVDPRRGRIRFLFRGEGHVYLEPAPADLAEVSDEVRRVYEFLRSEGAAFFADLCAALELPDKTVENALVELVMAGWVTNDSVEAMRQIVQRGAPRTEEPKPLSSLEEQLARRWERLGPRARPFAQKPTRSRYHAAARRVRSHIARSDATRWVGRWSAVHRFGVLGKPVPATERIARQTRQLLARYGVVTRESLADEIGAWEWLPILRQLQHMEMRGEVRRGYFVQRLPGLQFALPNAVEELRAARDRIPAEPELVVLNACDPANLYGPARDDGPQTEAGEPLTFSRVPSTWLVQERGLPVLVARDGGAHVVVTQGVGEGLVQRALCALLDHLARSTRRLTVETWNGTAILDSPGRLVLEGVGFYRDYPGMTWERRP